MWCLVYDGKFELIDTEEEAKAKAERMTMNNDWPVVCFRQTWTASPKRVIEYDYLCENMGDC